MRVKSFLPEGPGALIRSLPGKSLVFLSALWFISIQGVQATEPPLRNLLEDFKGGNPQAQALARQRLPSLGLRVVPDMLQLLSGKDEKLSKAACDIILQLINDVSAPGREKDRKKLADQLVPLIAPDRSEKDKVAGLRLLERLVPPGYDVAPIAGLLSDNNLREKARTALQRINTGEARNALRSAVASADPLFQVALLNSLGEMKDAEGLEIIIRLAVVGTPEVQAAAIRALSWTGDPSYLALARSVRQNATGESRFDSFDATLRLLEAMTARGGNWEAVVREYGELLKTSSGPSRQAVISALGQIGDERHVDLILGSLDPGDPQGFHIGLHALSQLRGAAATHRMVSLFPQAATPTKIALLPILAAKNDESTLPHLVAAARSADPAFRKAGLEGLGVSGQPSAIPVLEEFARSGNDEEKKLALRGLLTVGQACSAHGVRNEASRAMNTLYQLAQDDSQRREALKGMASNPSPESLDSILAAAQVESLRDVVFPALQALAGTLVAAGQGDKAMVVYKKILEITPGAQDLAAAAAGLQKLDPSLNVAEMVGFVTQWWVVGPFPLGEDKSGWDQALIGEPNVDLAATYPSGDKQAAWKRVQGSADIGKVDLLKEVADCQACLCYAYTEIEVSEEADAVLCLGVDDGEKVWYNSSLVLDNFTQGALVLDRDKIPVHLKKGINTLLLKVYQNAMPWEFCVRILSPEGVPVSFTQKKP